MNAHPHRSRRAALLALLLLAGCNTDGDFGDGGASQFSVAFVAGSSFAPEAGGEHEVLLVLLATGSETQTPLRIVVTLEDTGQGSAQPGTDYTPPQALEVEFPEGSSAGATVAFALEPLADQLVEGLETVELRIAKVGSGASAGDARTHTVRIEDANEALLRFVSATSATADESTGPHAIDVELVYSAGDELTVAPTVVVSDRGTGSATSGVDYAAFAQTTLSWPIDAPPGTVRTVTVQVQDDDEPEGDETVELELSAPAATYTLGTSLHTMTITEDEVVEPGNLVVTQDPGGADLPVAHGDTLDFGSQVLGAGPGAGILVRFENTGVEQIDLAAPELVGAHVQDFQVSVETAALGADAPPAVLASPLAIVRDSRADGAELALDPSALARLAREQRVLLAGFALPGGGSVDLELERVPSPWGRGARVLVDGAPFPGGPAALVGELSMWKGRVAGQPGSRVFLSLSAQGARGSLSFSGTAGDELLLVRDRSTPGAAARALWRDQLAVTAPTSPADFCTEPLPIPGRERPSPSGVGYDAPPLGEATSPPECRLALETDFQFFELFGSSEAAVTYVTELVAAVSERYLDDVGALLSIEQLGIWTTAGDPWSTPDSGSGTTIDMLLEFQQAWAPSFGGSWPVSADLAHFLSGAVLGGGVAYIDGLCDIDFGFAVSADITGGIDWSTFDGSPAGFNWDFVVFAHELGHNFNALHTHEYCPALDHCYPGPCSTDTCSEGTLMSYCHLCPGGLSNTRLEFHPFVANEMRAAVNVSCLGVAGLRGGDGITYRYAFDPTSATGAKTATSESVHDAPNATSPFQIALTGTATD